jgi:hypothetical protein
MNMQTHMNQVAVIHCSGIIVYLPCV